MIIDRKADIALVRTALRRSRAVAILGPRQCGKTTLARHFVSPDSLNYFDLEEPQSLARLAEPATTLRPSKAWLLSMKYSGAHTYFRCCVFLPIVHRFPHDSSFSAALHPTCYNNPQRRSPAGSRRFPAFPRSRPVLGRYRSGQNDRWTNRSDTRPSSGKAGAVARAWQFRTKPGCAET